MHHKTCIRAGSSAKLEVRHVVSSTPSVPTGTGTRFILLLHMIWYSHLISHFSRLCVTQFSIIPEISQRSKLEFLVSLAFASFIINCRPQWGFWGQQKHPANSTFKGNRKYPFYKRFSIYFIIMILCLLFLISVSLFYSVLSGSPN